MISVIIISVITISDVVLKTMVQPPNTDDSPWGFYCIQSPWKLQITTYTHTHNTHICLHVYYKLFTWFIPLYYNNNKTNYSSIKHNSICTSLQINEMYMCKLMIKTSSHCLQELKQNKKLYVELQGTTYNFNYWLFKLRSQSCHTDL
jgi:hypothetical protein